jgi:hypothetical protein
MGREPERGVPFEVFHPAPRKVNEAELMFDLALQMNVTFRSHEAAESAPSQ